MAAVPLVLALAHHIGVRLAEIGFLPILIAGAWLVAAEIPALRFAQARRIVGGLLLVITTHADGLG